MVKQVKNVMIVWSAFLEVKMATGKELVRLLECAIWEKLIEGDDTFCSALIYDCKGLPISKQKAKKETFCHLKVLFTGLGEKELKLMSEIMRLVASTSCEQMNNNIHEYYSFEEIIIS